VYGNNPRTEGDLKEQIQDSNSPAKLRRTVSGMIVRCDAFELKVNILNKFIKYGL